jgi:flagellar basal-body rod modification protein FlgD
MDSITTANRQAAVNRVAESLARTGRATANATTNVLAAAGASAAAASVTKGNTITSNDFLTLLVTEMKNQDPTQPTDPNAYIQQLVGVNSLQQLIAINQDLTNSPAKTTGTKS